MINEVLKDQLSKPVVDLAFLNPIQDPEVFAKKQSIVDVLCKDQDGAHYIIEMQVANQSGFKERAQYYASRAFVSQIRKGGTYYELKKIIFPVFPDQGHYKSEHETRDKKTNTNDLTKLRITFVDLTKFEKERTKPVKHVNLEEKRYYFLAKAENLTPTEKEALGQEPIIKKALRELEQFNWSDEELVLYERAEKSANDYNAMISYAVQKGRAEELQKLIQQLIAQGVCKTVDEANKKLS